mgnify:CR=1 FL=1
MVERHQASQRRIRLLIEGGIFAYRKAYAEPLAPSMVACTRVQHTALSENMHINFMIVYLNLSDV